MEKKMIVDVTFSRKNGKFKVALKALHNGSLLVDKAQMVAEKPIQVFEFTSAFITKHEATNISLKRGMLEDSFAKYLTEIQSGEVVEEDKEIEGILVESISKENRDLLADLRTYKLCVQDAVRHKDYEGMLMQGILYNVAREELEGLEGKLANPFEAEVTIPLSDKSKVIEAVISMSKAESSHGINAIESKKYNRLILITKTDYKLTVNLS